MTEDQQVVRARINAETARIAWSELQRFFAQGTAVYVAPELDLVDVAWEFSCDNKARIESLMEQSGVGPVSDSQALEWLESNTLMWAVVIKPLVLVQPILAESTDELH